MGAGTGSQDIGIVNTLFSGPNGPENNVSGYVGSLVSAGTGSPLNKLANSLFQDGMV